MSYRTPTHVIEELRSILIVDGNFTKFKKRLDELMSSDEEEFHIQDLGTAVMSEAIRRDSTPFISELLSRGMTMSSGFVWRAIYCEAIGALEVFLWNGWDINTLDCEMEPPLLA